MLGLAACLVDARDPIWRRGTSQGSTTLKIVLTLLDAQLFRIGQLSAGRSVQCDSLTSAWLGGDGASSRFGFIP
jgi:hypothetical protein